jgi:hypothetical protein
MTAILRAIPLLLFPAILYGAVAMTMPHGEVRASLDQVLFSLALPSGALFEVTRGHALTLFAAALLFIEVVKSTQVNTASLVENGLAFAVFVLALILFLLTPAFGTIEFALIMAMMLIDFMAGFIVMTISARRDVSFNDGG